MGTSALKGNELTATEGLLRISEDLFYFINSSSSKVFGSNIICNSCTYVHYMFTLSPISSKNLSLAYYDLYISLRMRFSNIWWRPSVQQLESRNLLACKMK